MRSNRRHHASHGINEIIAESRERSSVHRRCVDRELADSMARLRYRTLSICRSESLNVEWQSILIESVSLAIEAVRRTHAIDLFDVQLHAGIVISRGVLIGQGCVAEMQTGEGKTFAMLVATIVASLANQGVHVATPNAYLARREHDQLSSTLALLGLSAGCLRDDASNQQTRDAYRADVTYGPGHAFGFDYLRDQLVHQAAASRFPGTALMDRLQSRPTTATRRQRGLAVALIDEIDHVLIDDALSPLVLSATGSGEADDAAVYQNALTVASQMRQPTEYQRIGHTIEITDDGLERVYREFEPVTGARLRRPWHEYVELTLRANQLLKRDVHYVIDADQVRIVDGSTGRIYEDRTYSGGMQQAIAAKEGLCIPSESANLARITRQRFYRAYRCLAGLTGTAMDCRRELMDVYEMPVETIEPRIASKRIVHPATVCRTESAKTAAIAEEAQRMVAAGRCVLIGTLNIESSREIVAELRRRQQICQLLNGLQNADEADVVSRAGQPGAITVATNLAGRGTDIRLHPDVAQRGGMHVIVAEHHRSARVDRQLVGRCARCGDPGSSRAFISAEDDLVSNVAPWLGRAIVRALRSGNADALDLQSPIAAVQRQQAKRAAAARRRLLAADDRDQRMLSPPLAAFPAPSNLQTMDVG